MRLRTTVSARAGRALLLAWLVFVWSGGAALLRAGPARLEQQDAERILDRLFAEAKTQLATSVRDPSDIAARVAAVGREPEKLLAFVRDQVATEPYRGSLRGARGTLACGAGNSLDRALLLCELLKAAGHQARLAKGTLADAPARELLARFRGVDPLKQAVWMALASAGQPAADPSALAAARDLPGKIGAPAEMGKRILDRAARRAEVFWWDVDEERTRQADMVAAQLAAAGVKPQQTWDQQDAELLARVKEHYWAQVKDAAGNWTDLDPALPQAKPGQRAAENAGQPLKELPAEAQHRFELSVIYRSTVDGKPKEEVILQRAVPTADAPFAGIEFRIQPADPNFDAASLTKLSPRDAINRLRGLKKLQPNLRIGDTVVGGRPFDLAGNTYDVDSHGMIQDTAGQLGSSVGGLFGGITGDEGSKPKPAFVDVTVVLCITGPDGKQVSQSRTLARAVDLKAADFLPPLLEWEIFVQPQVMTPDLVAYQSLSFLVSQERLLIGSLEPRKDAYQWAASRPAPPMAKNLLPLAMLRQAATARVLGEVPGVTPLYESATVTIAGHRLVARGSGDATGLLGHRSVDIVENHLRFVPREAAAASKAYEAALRQGVADCTLESRFLREAYPTDATASGSAAFDRGAAGGGAMTTVAANDAEKLKSLGLGATDLQWIARHEGGGNTLLVAPATAAGQSAAWWSVRPDGTCVRRSSGGFGNGDTDYALLTMKIAGFVLCGLDIKSLHDHGPSNVGGWAIVSCIVASGVSGGMLMGSIHGGVAWFAVAVEMANWCITGMVEASE